VGLPDSPVVHRTVAVHCPVRLLAPALTSARVVALFTVTPLVLLPLKLEHNIISIDISCVCHT
jgi:hypothetical protein